MSRGFSAHARRRGIVVVLLVCTAAIGVLLAYVALRGRDAAAPPASSSRGHDRMLALLGEIAERAADENLFVGDGMARRIHEQLSALPASASRNSRWRLHMQAGEAELIRGNESESIDHFTQAIELLTTSRSPIPPGMLRNTLYRLGVAYLRLGETQNCCLRHTPESCILPLAEGGVHTQPEGSQKAIDCFTLILRSTPARNRTRLKAQWLLNLAYMTLGGYPQDVPEEYRIPPEAFRSKESIPRFRNVAPHLGLATFDLAGGAIADDFDNDGYLDIVVSTWAPDGQMRFFRNNRDGTFSDRTEAAGLRGLVSGLNLIQADYDNDGDVDILVLRGAWLADRGRHPNSLLQNNGKATFTDVTFEAGLGDVHFPTQTASWADYDLDGDLDLFVGNESTPDLEAPCQLFRNNGDGTFVDVAGKAGVRNFGTAKGVVWGDYDGDRLPDLYVSNLGGVNRLYHNEGDGTFIDTAARLGVEGPTRSFAVWFWDFDNDGALDLYAATYVQDVASVAAGHLGLPVTVEAGSLYRGDGGGGFVDVARRQKLTRRAPVMGANFGDLDNDGFLDFYLGTGAPDYEKVMPNIMFRNRGGTGFSDVTYAGGFGHLQKGHAVVFADLDNDGDQDIFEQMGGFFRGDRFSNALFENPGFGNHWITVKLVGVHSNRSAIGARIEAEIMENGRRRSVYKHVNSGGSFGANPLRQTIGLGGASRIEALRIFWPRTGRTQTFQHVPVDQFIQIVEDAPDYKTLTLKKMKWGPTGD